MQNGSVVWMSGEALQGKAVVVTGAGRGLGRAYATEIAAQGAAVVLSDVDGGPLREAADAIAAAGGAATTFEGSVAEWDGAAGLVAHCVEAHGRIDGLVNNAAVFHVAVPWEETEDAMRR